MTDQTAATPAPPHPGVAIQHAVHAALRRDLDRLVAGLGTAEAPDLAINAYAEEFLFQLHHHHTFEDDTVWPLMRERLGESWADLLDRNVAEHGDVVASVDAFVAALAGLDVEADADPDADADRSAARAAAHDRAIRMREVVDTHLQHEEADVIPLVPGVFTLEDVGRFQAESAKENPPDRFLPWLLESAPAPVASGFKAVLPPPVQELLATTWMPVWQAKVDALTRGAAIHA